MPQFLEPVVHFFNTYFPTTSDRLVIGAFALAAIIILVLFVRGFVKGLRARRRASGNANAEDTRSSHVAFFFDRLDENSSLPENVAGLALALGEIEIRRQRDNERNPAFELTKFGGGLLVGLIALSLLGNATLGYAVYRGQMGQRVLAAELVRVRTQVAPIGDGWGEVGLDQRFNDLNDRLAEIEYWSGSVELVWLHRNLDELNRMRLADAGRDTDGDGVFDTEDDCPNTHNEGYDDTVFPGCPDSYDQDTDDDQVFDIGDRCPNEFGIGVSQSYSPWIATEDRNPIFEEPRQQIRVASYGCPDGDGDEIPDRVDLCPEAHADDDENFDGCPDEEQDFSQGGVVDYRYVTEKPAYDNASGKLVGRFTAERTVAGVTFEFLIACEAMGADGTQLASDADRALVTSWGTCRPVGR